MCSYVNRSLADVVHVLDQPDLPGRMRDVSVAAFGDDPLTVVPEELVQVSDTSAQVPLTWQASDRPGAPTAGRAAITAIVVRSGSEPRTEILLTLWDADSFGRAAIGRSRRFLDELAAHLSRATPRPMPTRQVR